jgi:Imidazolonepropionase and related amidohydrolases
MISKRAKLFPCILLLTLLLHIPLVAQDVPQVFRGALIYPIVGEPIEKGVLVVQGGKIVAVGKAGEVQVPAGAVEHNVEGKVILPGLVDTHSHIGRGDGGDASGTLHPSVRILDAIDPRATNFKKALVGGIQR